MGEKINHNPPFIQVPSPKKRAYPASIDNIEVLKVEVMNARDLCYSTDKRHIKASEDLTWAEDQLEQCELAHSLGKISQFDIQEARDNVTRLHLLKLEAQEQWVAAQATAIAAEKRLLEVKNHKST